MSINIDYSLFMAYVMGKNFFHLQNKSVLAMHDAVESALGP